MKKDHRPTIADLRALKGQRQLSMLRVETLDEAQAAQQAGVDMLSVPPALLGPAFREAAPTVFAIPGLEYGDFVTAEEYLRAAFKAMKAGGDAVYCAASMGIVRRLRDEGIPVCGHSGLIPSQATWTGGFKAVGKTLETAMLVWQQVKALEDAGAFAAEIEVVPGRSGPADFRAHQPHHDLHGSWCGRRCAVPLCLRRAGLQQGSHTAPRQGLSQLRGRI